jgi:membrane-bound metal-dependent hydrolase YbcI (DUF457 family)
MLAQFGVRQRFGAKGVVLLVAAGIAPDLDAAVRVLGAQEFWRLHHALGHSLVSIAVISAVVTCLGWMVLGLRQTPYVFCWCFAAACVHSLTDVCYWWGIQPLWPVSDCEFCLGILEYLDLLLLALWLGGAVCLYKFPARGTRVAASTLAAFVGYVTVRAVLPPPGGVLGLVLGKWMYVPPNGTPVLDWW